MNRLRQEEAPVSGISSPTLSREEAAQYLGISASTLENWATSKMKRELLPFTKVGRIVRYFRVDLDAYLQRNYNGDRSRLADSGAQAA